MKKLKGNDVIKTFLGYFEEHGHKIMESGSLIPHDDPSVLWINAGVTPLKKYFDGTLMPPCKRLTSCQKCIRTGDIEVVGKTARHHTFFQMLGNFSIGDYFKKEALTMALELLTSPKYFDIDVNKLYITVYPSDTEAIEIWKSLGIKDDHIIKLEGNYWEIGPGPSGPDSEIFYDRGSKYDKENQGIKLLQNDIENDRYIEIWNNVFSQYNAKEGVKREAYEELPSKNIDTGMGVERMACILQETETNYETDMFMPIMDEISNICHIEYFGQIEFKVIADHIRTLVFALGDGATFENYGRGYVLRRLLRRAVRMSRKLNINHSFMSNLVKVVVDNYKEIYPYLVKEEENIKELITKEEELFHKTLLSGEKRLEELFTTSSNKKISGKEAFKLYDTYGFPVELTTEIAEEKGFTVDTEEFKKYMDMQKETARSNRKNYKSMNMQSEAIINYKEESEFVGYDTLTTESKVIGIIRDDELVNSSSTDCLVILDKCPFYAESGGQVSDQGTIKNESAELEVLNVIKSPNGQNLIHVEVKNGLITTGDTVTATVDKDFRSDITKNHSAVHLLQKTLQDIFGDSLHQAGSNVTNESFRFDFNYRGRLSDEIITKVEEEVNKKISQNIDTHISYMKLDEAKKRGAMALFEDKYGDIVRVVELGDSIELCGGTHVKNTGDIKKVGIINVENKGSDIYRITGTSDRWIIPMMQREIAPYNDDMIKLLGKVKKILMDADKMDIKLNWSYDINNDAPTCYNDIVFNRNEVKGLKEEVKNLEKKYMELKSQKSVSDLSNFMENINNINNINTVIAITKDYDVNTLKQIASSLSNRIENSFILLANVGENSVNFVCKNKTTNENIDAGKIIKHLSLKCSGNGGGNKTFAQGGGSDTTNVSMYLKEIKESLAS